VEFIHHYLLLNYSYLINNQYSLLSSYKHKIHFSFFIFTCGYLGCISITLITAIQYTTLFFIKVVVLIIVCNILYSVLV